MHTLQLKNLWLRKLTTILAVFLLPGQLFSQPAKAAMKQYEAKAFSISYPTNWTLDTSRQQGTDVMLFSPLQDSSDQFRENINVITQNLEGLGINLEKYTAISEQQIHDMFKDADISYSADSTTAKGTFHKIVYSASAGNYTLKFIQYYFVKNSKAYVVTFSSELKSFDLFQPVADRALSSFSLR